MSDEILDMKLSFILSVAEKISNILNPQSDALTKAIDKFIDNSNAITAKSSIASTDCMYMILCEDPHKLLTNLVDELRSYNSKYFQETLNPVNIFTKLTGKEFRLDVNGMRLCYAVKSSVTSQFALKAIACKEILSVRSFESFIIDDSNTMDMEKVKEIYPSYDYKTKSSLMVGSRKKMKPPAKNKYKVKINVISRLVEFVKTKPQLSDGLIFLNESAESDSSAITIIYTDRKYKEALEDFMKESVEKYHKDYNFKSFLHSDFDIPYDFRLKKSSFLLNEKKTKEPIYIANLYNLASYMPLPCSQFIVNDTYINVAHPLVSLLFLYIDMFILEYKSKKLLSADHVYMNKVAEVIQKIETYSKIPQWIGVYNDETYAKIKFSLRSVGGMSIETPII